MASAELSRRVEKVVGYPPLSELSGSLRVQSAVSRDHEERKGRKEGFAMTDRGRDWVDALRMALATRPNQEERSPVERAREARERADAARGALAAARTVMLNAAGLVDGPARGEWDEAQGAIVTAERAVIRAMRAL